jgi:hypothetical protein
MWNSPLTFGPNTLNTVLTGLNAATAVGQVFVESAYACGDAANNLSSNINSTLSFVLANTVGKVPDDVWTVIDDIGTATMGIEGVGAIPKEIATFGRGAKLLSEGSIAAKSANIAAKSASIAAKSASAVKKSVGPVYKSAKEAAIAAKKLGATPTKHLSHGQKVYKYGKNYITRDTEGHIGGAWKMAKSPESLGSKATRMGTYDENLKWIGD